MAAPLLLILLLVGGAIVLVGLAGVVLLIVGLIKKWTALWVCGIIGIVLAGLAVLLAVPVVLFLGVATPHRIEALPATSTVEMGGTDSGNFVRNHDGHATARAEGVDIEVLAPGSGRASYRTHSTSTGRPRRSQTRHEITIGEVEIVVENRDSRLTLSVGGHDYGPVRPGDRVVVTEDRNVLVNGQPRLQ